MRPATLADYRWLYAHGYMLDGLKCARAIMLDIVDRCPATFIDHGCGRGHLVEWINSETTGSAIGWDPSTGIDPEDVADWGISCDVLEHIPREQVNAFIRRTVSASRLGLLLTIANMSDVHEVDGEQVQLHLIREPMPWWTNLLHDLLPSTKITGRQITANGDRFAIIVEF